MIRELTEDLKGKAKEELGENEKRVRTDLELIKEWLKKQPHLRVRLGKFL